jgi:hypothetical protein
MIGASISSFAFFAIALLLLLVTMAQCGEYINWDAVKARAGKKAASEASNAFVTLRYYPFDIAPSGLVNGPEVDAIWRVVNARRAQQSAPREQFAIRYAVYNLQNVAVIDALGAAVQANCLVQIVVDSSKLDNSAGKEYQNTDEILASKGLPIFAAGLGKMTAEQRKGSFMTSVSLPGRALFHLKLRHFTRMENGRSIVQAFTGSTNPTVESTSNDETYIELHDDAMRQKYAAYLQHIVDLKDPAAFPVDAWSPTAPLQFSTSPGPTGYETADRILNLIDAEKELIMLSVFSLRNFNTPTHAKALIDSLTAAVARGAVCVVVTDKKQATHRVNFFLRKICFSVYEALNDIDLFNAMHCKDALFGITNTTIVTDASNWSENALGSCVDFDTKKFAYKSGTCTKAASIESALFIRTGLLNDNGETRRRALHHMMLLHTRYQRQQSTSTPTATAVWDMLNNKFGKQRMPFHRMQIYVAGVNTSYGDFVAIRGQMCTDDSCSSRQDVRIRPFNMQNRDSQWHKASYDMLTWGEDSALDYVCNTDTRAANGIDATYDVDGYGFDAALDTFAVPSAWRFDAYVDAPHGAWVQFKAVVVRAGGSVLWEKDIATPTASGSGTALPRVSSDKNHWARVGFTSVVQFNAAAQSLTQMKATAEDTDAVQAREDGGSGAVPVDENGDFVATDDGASKTSSDSLVAGIIALAIIAALLLVGLIVALVLLRKARVAHA